MKRIRAILRSPLQAPQKQVLVAIAAHVDTEDGFCHAPLARVIGSCPLTTRQSRTIIERLVKEGILQTRSDSVAIVWERLQPKGEGYA